MRVAAEARRHSACEDLERAAHRVPGFPRQIDGLDHLGRKAIVDAPHRRVSRELARPLEADRERILERNRPQGEHVAGDLDPETGQQLPGNCAGRDPCGGLARARALQNVTQIRSAVLDRARQIRMSGPWTRDSAAPCAAALLRLGADAHRLLPVLPVLVPDEQRDRAADRFAVAHAGENLRAVGFDRHPPAASITALAAPQLCGERVEVDREPCGNAFEDGDERLAVRFAGGEKPHHQRFIVYEVFAPPGRSTRRHRAKLRQFLTISSRRHARMFSCNRSRHRSPCALVVALFADRFLPLESGPRHLDLATGRIVFVRRIPAGDRSEQTACVERAARLAGVWHPHLAMIVDFGLAGAAERFEAFPISRPTPVRRDVARAIRSVLWFLGAAGLSSGPPSRDRIRDQSGRPVLVPDALTGHDLALVAPDLVARWKEGWRALVGPGDEEEPRPFVPGIVLQPRRVADGVLDLLSQAGTGRAGQVVITGPAGSGLSSLSRHIAREARRLGFVPIAPAAFARHPRGLSAATDLVRNRFLLVLGDGLHDPDGRDRQAEELLLTAAASGGPSAVLLTIARVSASPGATAIDPIPERSLAGMLHVFPPGRMARGRLAHAARAAAGRPGRMLVSLGLAQPGELDPSSGAHVARVAETQPAYDAPSVVSFPRSGDKWGTRAARGLALAAAGRHAAAERLLREAAAGLRRHGGEVQAAQCTVALGKLLLDRGRPTEARELLETTVTPDFETHVATTTTIGVCLIEEARLRDAETALRAACAIGTAAPEASRLALARCLFWQARMDEAAEWIAPAVEANHAAALRRLSAIELSRHETAAAGRLAMLAVERAEACGDAQERARGHAAAIRALAGIGEREAVLRHARDGLAAARAARAPLAALDVRLAVGFAAGADAGLDRGVWRSLERLRRDRLPPFWRARVDALLADIVDDARKRQVARAAVAAFVRASGAEAMRPSPNSASRDAARVITGLLELCQEAEDDEPALGRACTAMRSRLRAAAVALFGPLPQEQKLASAGTFERGTEVVGRTLASGLPIGPIRGPLGIEAAAPVRSAGSVVGALACRWALDAAVEARAFGSLLEPSAAALAPAVRAWLDRRTAPRPEPNQDDASIVAASPPMAELTRAAQRAAQAPFPVLIEGESGVGKELVARAVHRDSPRRARRFVAVNCAALPDDLIEAELFGHARGAFTGATSERPGLFEEADGGTLFLDEVSELAPRAQAKLLRAIQDGEIRRVGENMPRRLDVRLVAASNRSLDSEVAAGRFRPDLLFRLAVIRLTVPPLRERPADIHTLAQRFWQSAAARTNCRASLDADTLAALARYDWPGNVRELQNVMSALAVHAPRRGRVGVSALPPAIAAVATAGPRATLDEARHSFERQFVSTALARAGGHHSRAAVALGVSRQGLAKLIKRLGLNA